MDFGRYTGEIWKDIPGFEGWYQASSLGRVRSLDRTFPVVGRWGPMTRLVSGRIITPHQAPQGYLNVRLCKQGYQRKAGVHVLVCEAFHGLRPDDRRQVAHGDGDRANNRPENLRWATQRENEADKQAHGTIRRGEASPQAKLREADIPVIRQADGSNNEIAARFGVSSSTIAEIRRGVSWSHVRG